MFKKIVITFALIFCISDNLLAADRLAFCCTSIADVLKDQQGTAQTTYDQVKNAYANLPISWGPDIRSKEVCPRIYQLLLHELVLIQEETEHEYFFAIPQAIMLDHDLTLQLVSGWTLKENLWPIDNLATYKNLLPAVSTQTEQKNSDAALLFLASPYTDENGNFYSAGTQFLVDHTTTTHYIVFAFDCSRRTLRKMALPHSVCSYQPQTVQPQEQREMFCELITLWANRTAPTVIPLVWGGCSIGKVWNESEYYPNTRQTTQGNQVAVWDRPKYGNTHCYMGVDASGVVLRAAQTVGIAYFIRNSFTAAHLLNPLKDHEYPLNGDLIWVAGGLFVINSLEQNTIVTTMSYTAGYGCLMQLPLNAVFKNITTYKELVDAYRFDKPIELINRDGSTARIVQSFEEFKILRLPV